MQQFLPGRYKGKTTRKRVRVRARVRAHTPCRLSPQLPTRGAPRGAGWALQLGWFGGTRAMALGLEEAALHLEVTSPCLRSVTLLSPCHLRAAAGHRAGPPAPWGQWDPSQTDELPLDIGWPQQRWPHIPPCSPGSKGMTAPSIKGMLPHCPQWKWGTVMFEGGRETTAQLGELCGGAGWQQGGGCHLSLSPLLCHETEASEHARVEESILWMGKGGRTARGGWLVSPIRGCPWLCAGGPRLPSVQHPWVPKSRDLLLPRLGPSVASVWGGCWHPGRRGGGFTCGSVEWAASFAPPLILLTGRNGLGAVAAGFRGAGPHQVDATR